MQDDEAPDRRYAGIFNGFFKDPDMASTYKPVFLAGLVDIAARKVGGPLDVDAWIENKGDRVCVDLNLAAVPFAKFYWDMLAGFSPRHTPARMADDKNRSRDTVNIIKVIKEEMVRMKSDEVSRKTRGGGGNAASARGARARGGGAPAGGAPPTLKELASDKMAEFRQNVIKKSITPEVVWHLASNARKPRSGRSQQGARAAPKRRKTERGLGLYEYRKADNCIVLDAEAVAYMKRNEFTLKAALGELVDRHLEKNNPAARHIATMVNLNKACKDKSKEVEKLAHKAMPSRDDIGPLLSISLDLTGLVSLSKTKA